MKKRSIALDNHRLGWYNRFNECNDQIPFYGFSIFIRYSSNLSRRSVPQNKFLNMTDKYHLSQSGTSQQAANLKKVDLYMSWYQILSYVDSLLFVKYQFSWFLGVQANHEFKCLTHYTFSTRLYAKPRNNISTKRIHGKFSSIHDNWYHENKWIHTK